MITGIVSAVVGLLGLAFGVWKYFNRPKDPTLEVIDAEAKRQRTDDALARDSDTAVDRRLHKFDRRE